MYKSVYKFNIWYLNADGSYDSLDYQERLVVANSEEEAEDKLIAYKNKSVDNGYCDFRYVYIGVEIDNVID